MKDDYTTNSHYLNHTFLVKRLGECTLGVKGLIEGGRLFKGGRLIQMHGSNMQSLVKNGSQTPLDSKAFILLQHVMQLKRSARSQIPRCRHRVTGPI